MANPRPTSGYGFFYDVSERDIAFGNQSDWPDVSNDYWTIEVLTASDIRGAKYVGQRYLDGSLTNVWKKRGRGYIAQTAFAMQANPRRPPKKWMRDCVAGASKSARNPGAVCGALWYHKMSPAQRRAALRREGKDSAAALANPSTGATVAWVAGTVAVLGIGYLLLRPKTAAAATATPQPTPSPSPAPSPSPSSSQNPPIPPPSTWPKLPAKTCPVEQFALTTWGKNNGVAAYYLPNLATAPSLSKLPAFITFDLKLPLVVVISDGTFYQYDAAGNAVAAPDLQASYCQSQTFPSYTHGLHPASTFMV